MKKVLLIIIIFISLFSIFSCSKRKYIVNYIFDKELVETIEVDAGSELQIGLKEEFPIVVDNFEWKYFINGVGLLRSGEKIWYNFGEYINIYLFLGYDNIEINNQPKSYFDSFDGIFSFNDEEITLSGIGEFNRTIILPNMIYDEEGFSYIHKVSVPLDLLYDDRFSYGAILPINVDNILIPKSYNYFGSHAFYCKDRSFNIYYYGTIGDLLKVKFEDETSLPTYNEEGIICDVNLYVLDEKGSL